MIQILISPVILSVDLSGDVPSFNVLGDLVNANLHALKLSKDSVAVTGLFDLEFSRA